MLDDPVEARRRLAALLRHPGFQRCDWILLAHLARRIDAWSEPDVIGERELSRARHPFSISNLVTADQLARAAEQYPEQTRELLERLPQALVIVDQAYVDFAAAELDLTPTALSFANAVVVRTFSKAWGAAGLRVGYGLSHPQVAELLNRVRQPFNVNSLALVAAEVALDDLEHLQRAVAANRAGMAQLEAGLRALGLGFIPSVANFICVDLGRPAAAVNQALLERGCIVRPVANYGLPDHLRVSIGLEAENARLLSALGQALAA